MDCSHGNYYRGPCISIWEAKCALSASVCEESISLEGCGSFTMHNAELLAPWFSIIANASGSYITLIRASTEVI
jgi:hypothetical protein